jgi:hypothetical protein
MGRMHVPRCEALRSRPLVGTYENARLRPRVVTFHPNWRRNRRIWTAPDSGLRRQDGIPDYLQDPNYVAATMG